MAAGPPPPSAGAPPPPPPSAGAPPPPPSKAGPEELGQLRWRCRRGMKELDVLLARYMDERFCNASHQEQAAFRQLLETPDTILHAYCLGSEQPPPQFATLIERITATPLADRISLRRP